MKKYLLILVCINLFTYCYSQENEIDCIDKSINSYKEWIIKNNIYNLANPTVWQIYIYEADSNCKNIVFLISATQDKIYSNYVKDYYILDSVYVLIAYKKSEYKFSDCKLRPINNDLVEKINLFLSYNNEQFFEPCYRIVKIKNGVIKNKDYESFSEIPQKYKN